MCLHSLAWHTSSDIQNYDTPGALQLSSEKYLGTNFPCSSFVDVWSAWQALMSPQSWTLGGNVRTGRWSLPMATTLICKGGRVHASQGQWHRHSRASLFIQIQIHTGYLGPPMANIRLRQCEEAGRWYMCDHHLRCRWDRAVNVCRYLSRRYEG